MEQFKKWYLNDAENHINSCDMHPSKCYLCQMSKIMNGIYSGNYSQKLIKQTKNDDYVIGLRRNLHSLDLSENTKD